MSLTSELNVLAEIPDKHSVIKDGVHPWLCLPHPTSCR